MTEAPPPDGYDSWDEFHEAVDDTTEIISATNLGDLAERIAEYMDENDIDY